MTDPQVQKDQVAVLAEALQVHQHDRDVIGYCYKGHGEDTANEATAILAAMPDYTLVRRDELRGGAELRLAKQVMAQVLEHFTIGHILPRSCTCEDKLRALLADTPAQTGEEPASSECPNCGRTHAHAILDGENRHKWEPNR